jgi:hypothetical protein
MPASPEATMKHRLHPLPFTVALLLPLLSPNVASATQYISQPWQPLVETADLVGVIECVTAGEVVARYRVVESWKGPPAGVDVLVGGTTLPIVLCGDRLLVAAWSPRNHGIISYASMSAGFGNPIPARWRDERPDFSIPSPLHFAVLSPVLARSQPATLLGGYEGRLSSLRKEAAALFALDDERREAAVLQALIRWHILGYRSRSKARANPGSTRELEMRARSSNVDSVLSALLDYARRNRQGGSETIDVLGMGGGRYALAYLSKVVAGGGDFSHSVLATSSSIIRRRLGLEPQKEQALPTARRPPSETLDAMRDQLRLPVVCGNDSLGVLDARNRKKAFETLTRFDPAFVAKYLRDWYSTADALGGETQGYELGSYFGWKCPGDRPTLLRDLLHARDSYIQVAAAIYLCFEDEEAGMRALRELTATPGDPGAWAALNLARRGDKVAARRAIDALETTAGVSMDTHVHWDLQKRLNVLLSNSAKHSGIPQPPRWRYADEDEQIQVYGEYLVWWNKNQARLKLWDPWLENLKRQKIE